MLNDNSRRIGDDARDRGNWEAAAEAYHNYLLSNPKDAAIWVQLGHALKEQGQLDKAILAYDASIKLDPDDVDSQIHQAHLLKRMNDRSGAVRHFLAALRLAPSADVVRELDNLGQGAAVKRLLRVARTGPRLFLEVRDLLIYLDVHTTVTGITRVVLALVRHVLETMDDKRASTFAFITRIDPGREFFEVSRSAMQAILDLSLSPDITPDVMRRLIAEARATASPVKMKSGDTYVVPGAFWMIGDNGSLLAGMKERGVRVGVYVYDLIPITHSQYCEAGLTRGFATAFADNLPFIDFFLTISQFVAADLKSYISSTPYRDIPIAAVPLAHAAPHGSHEDENDEDEEQLDVLDGRSFVLCVCTVEARKNHTYLLDIWQRLSSEGIQMPDLVFVGRPGWRVADLMSRIEASNYLDGSLHILNGMTDAKLDELYRNCLFTMFPSYVEGWGLPVGESLSHGKVCVASSSSSIPEVGGDLVIYCDPHDLQSGVEVVRQLLREPQRLKTLEHRIKTSFKPRSWNDVAVDFFDEVQHAIVTTPMANSAPIPCKIRPGEVIDGQAMERATRRIRDYLQCPLHLVFAVGWRAVESDGVWLGEPKGKIVFKTERPATKIQCLAKMQTSGWIKAHNRLEAWMGEQPRLNDRDRLNYVDREMRPGETFWTLVEGETDREGVASLNVGVKGNVEAPEDNIPLALKVVSIAFSPVDDIQSRMRLIEISAFDL